MVYISDKYKDTDGVIASKKMFDVCGVEYRKLELTSDKPITLELTK